MTAVAEPAEKNRPSPTAALAGSVARLRTRGRSGDLDRLMLVVGGVLVPLGVMMAFLGWLGASGTVLLFEQIPYLISGGIIGLCLVFAGGFIYFSYWQTLLVRESRTRHDELMAALARMEGRVAPDAPPSAAAGGMAITGEVPVVRAGATGGALTVATPTGSMIHRPDCSVVAGRADVRPVTAGTPGFTPCKMCRPLTA